MTDKTISDLDPFVSALTGSEPLESVESGASKKTTTGDVAGAPPVSVALTTGSSLVTVPLGVRYFAITSGGTGGDELIDLPNPDMPIDGYANGPLIGQRVVFMLEVQTNEADVVRISIGGSLSIHTFSGKAFDVYTKYTHTSTGIVLDFLGAAAAFVWNGYEWCADNAAIGANDDTDWDSGGDIAFSTQANADGASSGILFNTGGGTTGTGPIQLLTGDASAGIAGDIDIRSGAGSATGGSIGLHAGDGGSAEGGAINITAGVSGGDIHTNSGSISIDAGSSSGAAGGGGVAIFAGASVAGSGGSIQLKGGDGDLGGGVAYLKGGDSTSGLAGSVFIDAGLGTGGTPGFIRLGTQNPLPTSDPGSAGALYILAGVLMISAG